MSKKISEQSANLSLITHLRIILGILGLSLILILLVLVILHDFIGYQVKESGGIILISTFGSIAISNFIAAKWSKANGFHGVAVGYLWAWISVSVQNAWPRASKLDPLAILAILLITPIPLALTGFIFGKLGQNSRSKKQTTS